MPSENEYSGRCFCGAVEISVVGKPAAMGIATANRAERGRRAPSMRSHSGPPTQSVWCAERIRLALSARLPVAFASGANNAAATC